MHGKETILKIQYHLLNIPNLIVVIALDRKQLEEAVRGEFGTYTDTNGYLAKFIQYEIDLPNDSNKEYATKLMKFRCGYEIDTKQLIASMLDSLNTSIRDMKIFIQKLNLICKEQKDGFGLPITYAFFMPIVTAFMLLLKDTNSKIYKKYFTGVLPRYWRSNNGVINFTSTRYQLFLNDIAKYGFNKIPATILSSSVNALIYIINLFDDVAKISREDLARYLGVKTETVVDILDNENENLIRWDATNSTNNLVQKLKIIK